jgi:xanthine dehydrogenase accessory factor
MISIWKEAINLFDRGQNFCVATIVSQHGSSPRHVGTKFLIRRDGSTVGTIGGGVFEAEVVTMALESLKQRCSVVKHFGFKGEDIESSGMICGGSAHVLIDYHDISDHVRKSIYEKLLIMDSQRLSGFVVTQTPREAGLIHSGSLNSLLHDETGLTTGSLKNQSVVLREIISGQFSLQPHLMSFDNMEYSAFVEYFSPEDTVYIFGAGHVGVCVAHLASYVGYKVTLIDDRQEFANHSRAPEADNIELVKHYENCMPALGISQNSYLVIVTRGHAHDRTVLRQALETPAKYIGMIGSRRKIKLIYDSLLKEGIDERELERVHSPIGLPIGGETPEEIALSIVAEMIQTKQRSGIPHSESPCMSD